MPTTLILGGSGKVARLLTQHLTAHNHTVHSVIRNPSQSASLSSLGAIPILQSLETCTVDDLAATIRSTGADAVVWCAGAGAGSSEERTLAVDRDAAIRCMDAVALAGVKRFVIVSALDLRDREKKPVPEWYNEGDVHLSKRVWGAIEVYMRAKLEADTNLRKENGKRGLHYTIVRPGRLVDEKGKGTVAAGKVHLGSGVSRDDVAGTVLACLENDGTIGLAFDVVGGDVPIGTAVKQISDAKIDCFEGYY